MQTYVATISHAVLTTSCIYFSKYGTHVWLALPVINLVYAPTLPLPTMLFCHMQKPVSTVLELLRMSVPDTPLLLVAFAAGAMAALGSALIPYYTGLIIDYASIDPNRYAWVWLTDQGVRVAGG